MTAEARRTAFAGLSVRRDGQIGDPPRHLLNLHRGGAAIVEPTVSNEQVLGTFARTISL